MAEAIKKAKAPAKPGKAVVKKAAPKAKATQKSVSNEEIARLAHRFWAERGHQLGQPELDWFRAEHELLGKAS